jgi:uncharacterized membrane protein YcaP (DUF421 family)
MPDDLFTLLLVRGDELGNLFWPGVSLLEKAIRPVLVYAFLLVGLRAVGKRELAQLNKFDLVVLLILSNTVQNAIIGNDNSVLGGLLGALVLLATNWLADRYLYSHPRLEHLFEGEPVVLVRDGQVCEAACAREKITRSELLAAIRRQGLADLAEVKLAVLETGGNISVVPGESAQERLLQQLLARLDRIEGLLARPAR